LLGQVNHSHREQEELLSLVQWLQQMLGLEQQLLPALESRLTMQAQQLL